MVRRCHVWLAREVVVVVVDERGAEWVVGVGDVVDVGMVVCRSVRASSAESTMGG